VLKEQNDNVIPSYAFKSILAPPVSAVLRVYEYIEFTYNAIEH
jgi:hypothetical protein